MGKSASLEGPGYKKGHASVSKIISMTKLTPRALAYVVVQVHCLFHLLSSSITIFFWHIMIGTFRNFRCWRMAYCRLHIQLQAVFLESHRYLGQDEGKDILAYYDQYVSCCPIIHTQLMFWMPVKFLELQHRNLWPWIQYVVHLPLHVWRSSVQRNVRVWSNRLYWPVLDYLDLT